MEVPMKVHLYKLMICLLVLLLIAPAAGITAVKKTKGPETTDPLDGVSLNVFKLRPIGPALTSGRISDFAVNPSNPAEFYVATSSGGVWKTDNAGTTFTPLFDAQGSYSIGCITMDPRNPHVIWVGTGENNNQRSVAYGDGVYKSEDGGASWKHMGLKTSEHIGMIAVDPRDSLVVYVGGDGPLWSAGGDRGLYKTMDGGKNWEAVLTISEHTGINEVHLDPRNPDIIYAAAHQRRRHVFTLIDGGPESGIYKSDDAGKPGKQSTGDCPAGIKAGSVLAMSPADPTLIYAIVEATAGPGWILPQHQRRSFLGEKKQLSLLRKLLPGDHV